MYLTGIVQVHLSKPLKAKNKGIVTACIELLRELSVSRKISLYLSFSSVMLTQVHSGLFRYAIDTYEVELEIKRRRYVQSIFILSSFFNSLLTGYKAPYFDAIHTHFKPC